MTDKKLEKATFGAGCFWGIQYGFDKQKGVKKSEVGYMGGTLDDPTYEDVCSKGTGHVEVVQLEFDPEVISYEELLELFWKMHDPTQVDRQGPDVGDQYRSVIFTHSEEQEKATNDAIKKLTEAGAYHHPIATIIEPAKTFWRAEEYHQKYDEKRGYSTCSI